MEFANKPGVRFFRSSLQFSHNRSLLSPDTDCSRQITHSGRSRHHPHGTPHYRCFSAASFRQNWTHPPPTKPALKPSIRPTAIDPEAPLRVPTLGYQCHSYSSQDHVGTAAPGCPASEARRAHLTLMAHVAPDALVRAAEQSSAGVLG